MEEELSASASDAFHRNPSPACSAGDAAPARPLSYSRRGDGNSASRLIPAAFASLCIALSASSWSFGQGAPGDDGLNRVQKAGQLRYGSDMEGGGPYAFPDPKSPRDVTGFEVDLMKLLASELHVKPVYSQGQWDKLLQLLDTRRIDIVMNGYEW